MPDKFVIYVFFTLGASPTLSLTAERLCIYLRLLSLRSVPLGGSPLFVLT